MNPRPTFYYNRGDGKTINYTELGRTEEELFSCSDDIIYINLREYENSADIKLNDAALKILGFDKRGEFFQSGLSPLPLTDESRERLISVCDMLEFPIYRKELSLTFLRTDKSEITLPCEAMLEGDMSLCLIAGNLSSLNVKLYIERKRSQFYYGKFRYFAALSEDMPCGMIQFENESPFNVLRGGKTGSGYNLMAQRLFAYPSAEELDKVLKSDFLSVVHPDDRAYFLKKIKHTSETAESNKCEFRIICYDGSVRLLSGTLTCTSTYYGLSVLQYVCLDITELYNAQCELILQNEKIKQNETSIAAMRDSLQDIMTNLPAGIIVYDIVNGKPCLKYISDNVYEVFGCDGSETGTPEGVCFENIISHINGSGNADSVSEFIYHTKNKSGGELYIRFIVKHIYKSADDEAYYIAVMDITERIISEKAQEKRNALYRLLLSDSDELLFEYDTENDVLSYSFRDTDGIRKDTVAYNYFEKIKSGSSAVSAETGKIFVETVNNAIKYGTDGTLEYSADRYGKGRRMYRMYFKTIKNTNDASALIVGRSIDIQKEVDSIGSFKKLASLDLLSMLDNRVSGEREIRKTISEASDSDKYAFILFDIDNFKHFNDTLGHPTGDIIIKAVSSVIKSFSSDDDILSRFGGDEFVLFGKYENEASLRKKADELRLYIHKVSKDTGVPTDVTVSIGVSLFQSDGKSFDELFRMSDNALYVSKQNGRDRVTFFCDKK